MTLLQLEYFTALAENLHYTKTAAKLNITQPSLSYEISELERSLGVPLFTLIKRRVHLTEYGKAFLPFAAKALQDLRDGQDYLKELSGKEARTVRLGYFHSIAADVVPEYVSGFHSTDGNERTTFRFYESRSAELLALLDAGDLDLAITTDPGEKNRTEFSRIFTQQLYLAVPANHPIAAEADRTGASSMEFADFAGQPQIMLKKGFSPRSIVDRLYETEKAWVGLPDIRFEVEDCNTAISYVITDCGVAILPGVPALSNRRVRSFPVTCNGVPVTRDVFLCRKAGAELPAAAAQFFRYVTK